MNIHLIEPYYTGSHKQWADGLKTHSQHTLTLLTMPGQYWKWRMHGAAITLAKQCLKTDPEPDLIIATDMLDLTTFTSLIRHRYAHVPIIMMCHENQLTYPWSPQDRDKQNNRDSHYGFINFASALCAHHVIFNSHYHRTAFLNALPTFLNALPDYNEIECIPLIAQKSSVLPIGLNLNPFDPHLNTHTPDRPLILWNHRWEHDKNPTPFFELLFQLQDENIDFELAILGESFGTPPPIFETAKQKLSDRIVQYGYAKSFEDYAHWLARATCLPVTADHDFFGVSTVEAIYCGATPILPNRLAYPEHIPPHLHDTYLYSNASERYTKVKNQLQHPTPLDPACRAKVAHYDWTHQIAHYDALFAQIFHTTKKSI